MVSLAESWVTLKSSVALLPSRLLSVYVADCTRSAPALAIRLTTCHVAPAPTGSLGSGATIDSNDWFIPESTCCADGGKPLGTSIFMSRTAPCGLSQ